MAREPRNLMRSSPGRVLSWIGAERIFADPGAHGKRFFTRNRYGLTRSLIEDGRCYEIGSGGASNGVGSPRALWSLAFIVPTPLFCENNSGRFPLADPLNAAAGRMDLGIHARLADPAGDQLREL